MKIKTSLAILLALALLTVGHAQTLDKAKLDQFFDRLAEKNKAMASLTIAKDGDVLYTRAFPRESGDASDHINLEIH
jgi:hypothetical protein